MRVAPRRLTEAEFVALIAMLIACVAFAVDAMLPALPRIGAELSPDAPNRAQLIVTSFVAGLGFGTLLTGPASDRFGRKPVMLAGIAVYILGAVLAALAPSLELLLLARFVQGLGGAGPRVVAIALVRDLYSGREMARMVSFVMTVFALIPAIAPTLGQVLIGIVGWRGLFGAFIVFGVIAAAWLWIRQPETLPPERRRRLSPRDLWAATREMWGTEAARQATLVQALIFAMMFSALSSVQQIFDLTYGRGDSFPAWFMLVAIAAATSNVLNAWLVRRTGMRLLIRSVLMVQIGFSALMMLLLSTGALPPDVEFGLFVLWIISIFYQLGLSVGNLNALALEPLGHIAGLAASVVAAAATLGSVALAIPVGLAFDGTAVPMAVGVFVMACLALVIASRIRRDSDPG